MPNWLTNPLLPKSTIEPIQDAIDSPSLDRSPLEAGVRGFGAGALEGLRQFTSPLQLAGLGAPLASRGIQAGLTTLRGLRAAPAAIQSLSKATPATTSLESGASIVDDIPLTAKSLRQKWAEADIDARPAPGSPADVPNNPVAQQLNVERLAELANWKRSNGF